MKKTFFTSLVLLAFFLLLFINPIILSAEQDILRILAWEGYAPEPVREKFETIILKKYNRKIKLEVTYSESSEHYFAPIRRKEVDLVTLTHHHFKDERFKYISNQLLLPINIENIPNYKHILPNLRNTETFRKDGKIYGVPVCQGLYALVYNRNKVKYDPSSWQVLWAAENKEAYAIGANEYLYNVCTAALAMGYPKESIGKFDHLNNQHFRHQLQTLASNAGRFWIGQDKAKYLTGMKLSAGWGDDLHTLRELGENWQFANPKEGCIYWFDSFAFTSALIDKPFIRKVAEEWVNFLLEPEFQVDYIVRKISQRPVTMTVGEKLTDEEKRRLHIDDPYYFSENHVLLPGFSRRDRNGLKLLWKEAMEGNKHKGIDHEINE